MAVNVLSLFSITGAGGGADRATLSSALIAVKVRNTMRAAERPFPSIPKPDIPDNADIVGPDSDYNYWA
jgi:hypothetical protein